MELFSEIYGTYYNAIEKILREGSEKPLSIQDMQHILTDRSFSESAYQMLPKLQSGDWPLLKYNGSGYSSVLTPPSERPLTCLQLSWLKAIMNDPRIHLFFDDSQIADLNRSLCEFSPLYEQDDFYIYDRAKDGDDYKSELYQTHFRVFLSAIHHKTAVSVQYEGGKGNRLSGHFWPYKLEYSSKDDKFRALCYQNPGTRKQQYMLNLGRVVSAKEVEGQQSPVAAYDHAAKVQYRKVMLEISKERNALERSMVQFAHFEKRTEYDLNTDRYTCTIKYNVMDETELVIRVLSFGPTIKVLGPEHFVREIRCRVQQQYDLLKEN